MPRRRHISHKLTATTPAHARVSCPAPCSLLSTSRATSSSRRCAVFLEPTVGEGSLFSTIDKSCGTYDLNAGCDYSVDPATVVTTADIRIYKPTVMASAATSAFALGDITALTRWRRI